MKPLVSIAITTYNHEKFITQCIESVLMQRTSFRYEIVIGHDASPDNTIHILQDYQRRYPDIIKLIDHKENVGLRKNNKSVWTACKGKYIAYLEGDDYWTSDDKLESLVQFLEKNNDYSAAYHQVLLKHRNSNEDWKMPTYSDERDLGFEANLAQWQVGTCSFVFRNFLNNPTYFNLAEKFLSEEIFWTDRPLMAFVSYLGPYKYIPHCMGVWRQHESNMTQIGDLSSMYAAGGIAYKKMYALFPEYKTELSEQVIIWNLKASEVNYKNKFWFKFLNYNLKAFISVKSMKGLKSYIYATFAILKKQKIYA